MPIISGIHPCCMDVLSLHGARVSNLRPGTCRFMNTIAGLSDFMRDVRFGGDC
jgi:hypothetical protein